MSLLYFILSGVLLYFLLKLGALLLKALAVRRNALRAIAKWFPIFETGSWVLFAFWGAYVLFGRISYYDHLVFVMAVLLVFGISWYFFRDIFAGMVLKSECQLHEGQQIKTPHTEGIIIQLGSHYLELENEKGEKLKIPYSGLSREWINIPAEADNALSNQFKLSLPDSADPLKVKSRIHQEMMGMPWIVGAAPKIKIIKGADEHIVLDIRYGLLKEEHALLVEQKIKRLIDNSTNK